MPILIPKNKKIIFKPGGLHIMFMNLKKNLILQEKEIVYFEFKNLERIKILMTVKNIRMKKKHTHWKKSMKQFFQNIKITPSNKGLTDITSKIKLFINSTNINNWLINISIFHTTASLIIQENADPSVKQDIKDFFNKIVPEDYPYKHNLEGLDDMPAHLKTCLTNTNLTISILDSELKLGTWQGIYLFEHRFSKIQRNILAHVFGE